MPWPDNYRRRRSRSSGCNARTLARENIVDDLGLRRWMVLLSMVPLVGVVSIVAVPVILTEGTEKRTLDALMIIASSADG